MDNFDLDINNYTITDIETLFGLSKGNNFNEYTIKDINEKVKNLKNKIKSSDNISSELKNRILHFMDNAKNILIFSINKLNNNDLEEKNKLKSITNSNRNIVEHENNNFSYTDNSQYYSGIINPLNKRIISNYLLIDSKFRDNYDITTSSNFMIQLPNRMTNIVSMQLTSFEIPVSFYGISSNYGNNTFEIVVNYLNDNNDLITEKKTIIVPNGNYNPFYFIQTINNLISPRDENGNLINENDIFGYISITLDLTEDYSGNGHTTFSTSGNKASSIQSFELNFIKSFQCNDTKLPLSSRIGYNLGFIKENYKDSTIYVSEMIIEPATLRYFYLAINDYNNNTNNQFIPVYKNSTTFNSSIIAKISVKGSYFSILMDNDLNITTEPRTYFGPVTIQKLHISLLDDHGRLMDMTHGNFSFTLLVKRIYDL